MRRILIDTHVFLWWLQDNKLLGKISKKLIGDGTNEIYVSAVSIWEISIKKSLGKLQAPDGLVIIVEEEGFEKLDISLHHAELIANLPKIHNDPFDRMLIAQAMANGTELMTADTIIPQYSVKTIDAAK